MKYITLTALLPSIALIASNASFADEVVADDLIVEHKVCLGTEKCADGEVFGDIDLKIKDDTPLILMQQADVPDRDWVFGGADVAGFTDSFVISDDDVGTVPFSIENSAPSAALHIADTGEIGMGTTLPDAGAELHIVTDDPNPSIILERTFLPVSRWEITGSSGSFRVKNAFISGFPFQIRREAPSGSLYINDDGDVGLGTSSPDAPLEVFSEDSFTFFRLSADGAAVNKSVDVVYTGGPLGTGQLRYNIVEGTGSQTPEMTLDADGNMVLTGTLTTSGPTCTGGCDRVFDAGFALPTIAEHADQMYAAGHLPSIGVTAPDAPVNLSERQGNIINSLEHAHIYINDLHQRHQADSQVMAAQQSELDQLRTEARQTQALLAALTTRLETLETQ